MQKYQIKKENINIDDEGWIDVLGFGRIGLWWSKSDKLVCLDYSMKFYYNLQSEQLEFIARDQNEVKDKIIELTHNR